MGSRSWHDDETKRRVTDLVREVESKSSAEIVVTVRPRSGAYRHADLAFGAFVAFTALCIYVYAPQEFADDLVPPALLMLFAASATFSTYVPGLRRLFTSAASRADAVRTAARAAFVDQRVTCTRDRTGILIFVSVFERRAEVVADIGILRREGSGQPARAIAEIERTIAEGMPYEAFAEAVRGLGAWLAEALPPRADDGNELEDAPRVE